MGRNKISLYLNTFFYDKKRKMNVSGKQNVSEWLFLEFLYLRNNFLSVIDLVCNFECVMYIYRKREIIRYIAIYFNLLLVEKISLIECN